MELDAEANRIFMTFVHEYAVAEEMTTDTLEAWLDNASDQDYANAVSWIAGGNVATTLQRVAKPLTREE